MLGSTDRPHLKLKAKETEDLLAFVIELLEAGLSWPYLSRECFLGMFTMSVISLFRFHRLGTPKRFPSPRTQKY